MKCEEVVFKHANFALMGLCLFSAEQGNIFGPLGLGKELEKFKQNSLDFCFPWRLITLHVSKKSNK